jgi:hypothetical protein
LPISGSGPELGVFSLSEIASIRLPFGLRIERDYFFETSHPLSVWEEAARREGSILAAEIALNRAVDRSTQPNIPPS